MKNFFASLLAIILTGGIAVSCVGPGTTESTDSNAGTADETTAETATQTDNTGEGDDKERMKGINEIKDWLGYLPRLGETPDEIVVIENFADASDKLLAESLQGITARTKAFLCTAGNNSEKWLAAIKEQLGDNVKISYISDVWAALERFEDRVPRKEYVLYNSASVNAACTIASAEGVLLATEGNASRLDELGYTMLSDARGVSDADAIRQYKDRLSTIALVQQTPSNYALRDFGIAYRLGFYYYNDKDKRQLQEAEEIHGYIDPGAPVFGWGPGGEYDHVKTKSNHGLVTVPSDHAWNLSLYSALPRERLEQINDYAAGTVAEDGRHYVALIMTDGDNVQWMVNDFAGPRWYGNAERGSIPMAWMIPPTLLDVAPQTAKWLYLQQTENDVFLNALSGTGYFFPSEMPEQAFDSQLEKLKFYMDACDFDTTVIMDSFVPTKKTLERYASIERLYGGILFTYPDKYKGAKGKIYWASGKPFVSVRNSLWEIENIDDFARSVAEDIKKLGYDITTPDAYSVIVVHCWSHTYSDAVEFARRLSVLDDKVEFVRADQLIKLVAENVKH